MRYRPTIIGIAAWIFLTGVLINTVINYEVLSAGEGWGVVGMFGLAGVGLAGVVVDLLIQLFRKKR